MFLPSVAKSPIEIDVGETGKSAERRMILLVEVSTNIVNNADDRGNRRSKQSETHRIE